MKMKHSSVSLILIASMLFTSACGAKLPELSDEEYDKIAEYAAMELIKYDANNRSRLTNVSFDISFPEVEDPFDPKLWESLSDEKPGDDQMNLVTPSEMGEGMVIIDSTGGDAAIAPTGASLKNMFKISEKLDVEYNGYEITDSYSRSADDFFVIPAAKGKKLVIVKMLLTNSGESTVSLDLYSRNLKPSIVVNEKTTKSVLSNIMLVNDLCTFAGDIKSGETLETVLLFELPEKDISSVSSIAIECNGDTISLE